MAGDLPVYRMVDVKGRPHTVSAIDGQVIAQVDAATAQATAQRFAGKPAQWLETAERDQWTVPNGLNAWRPLHRIAIDDGRGTELYISARTGEIMRDTHRAERFWNWLGSVPHWLYFTPIRKDPPLWRQVVLWTSGPCVAVAITGSGLAGCGCACGAALPTAAWRARRRITAGWPGTTWPDWPGRCSCCSG
ncbi:hypothetical protein [Cupriavidus sp. EM10]|uniref:hypothetical protein n=1 Tax=Cupriavidus sp. EM10 TaxID=2839983 RepID=UPI001CEC7AA4|nr:hypothetical protein [Cupriavidus sp. EM10]